MSRVVLKLPLLWFTPLLWVIINMITLYKASIKWSMHTCVSYLLPNYLTVYVSKMSDPFSLDLTGLEITKKKSSCPGDKCYEDLLVQMFSHLSSTLTRYWMIRSDFKALVPRTRSWRIYLSSTIFTCPGQEDNLFFQTLNLLCTISSKAWQDSWLFYHG